MLGMTMMMGSAALQTQKVEPQGDGLRKQDDKAQGETPAADEQVETTDKGEIGV